MLFFAPERTETDRFIVRSYRKGDGPALQAAVRASHDHLRATMPWADPTLSDEDSEALVRSFAARYLESKDFILCILAPDDRTVLGGTGFHLREGPLKSRCAEVGMWIHADHAGQGLGTAVLREMVRWGFTDWPWLRLSWLCGANNVASSRVAEKAGLEREGLFRGQWDPVSGERRDTACYAILRDEWTG